MVIIFRENSLSTFVQLKILVLIYLSTNNKFDDGVVLHTDNMLKIMIKLARNARKIWQEFSI
jgi:hypothetical protein